MTTEQALISLWSKFAQDILPLEEIKEITQKKLFKFRENKFGIRLNDQILGVSIFSMTLNNKRHFTVQFDETSPIIRKMIK